MKPKIVIPMTLRPRRAKSALLFFVCAIFVATGVLMVRDGQAMGYFCTGFFALCLAVFGAQLHPRAAYLHLAADGFTYCTLFRAHTYSWASIQEFGVTCLPPSRLQVVGWNFTPDYPSAIQMRSISRALFGYEAALPDTYGLKPEELADTLNNLRRQYAGARDT